MAERKIKKGDKRARARRQLEDSLLIRNDSTWAEQRRQRDEAINGKPRKR